MFHPVGPQPPTVYWRRRLMLLASVIVLVVLLAITLKVLSSGSSAPAAAHGTAHTTPPKTSGASSLSASSSSVLPRTSTAGTSKATRTSPSSTPAPRCDPKLLGVMAVTGAASYNVGQQPLLELQVTNTGPGPCVQDLADRQVELRVYNGESRVWGSHDCKIEPGVTDRTLPPNTPVRVAITWSGLSSRPGCAGTRQRVGAGTYTLYGLLSGKTGKAAQFTLG